RQPVRALLSGVPQTGIDNADVVPRLQVRCFALIVFAGVCVFGCSSGSHDAATAVTVVSGTSGGASDLRSYRPGVCPDPMQFDRNGAGIRRIMSDWQPTKEAAAFEAVRPCFPPGAKLDFGRVPLTANNPDTRPAVSDGARCFMFGIAWAADGRYRAEGEILRCNPGRFTSSSQ